MKKEALSKLPSELSGQRTFVRDESSRGTPTDTDRTPQSVLPPDKATPRAPSREDSNKKDNVSHLGPTYFNVPDGTAKEIKHRTIPAEGEQYGHPYQNGVNTLRHRVDQRTGSDELTESIEAISDVYLGEFDELEDDFDDEGLTAEEIEAATSRRWKGKRRPSKGRVRTRPRNVRTRSKRLRNRSRGNKRNKYQYNSKTKKVDRVKRKPKEILNRQKYDRDYNRRQRKRNPSTRKRQRGYYKRKATDMNLEAIQSVMAEMGLYEIRPPKTDELYVPSGVPYSPSGGNGYWKRDLPNRNRKPSERQDTSREPSDIGNSSRVVPQGQYVKASIRVAYRFLNG